MFRPFLLIALVLFCHSIVAQNQDNKYKPREDPNRCEGFFNGSVQDVPCNYRQELVFDDFFEIISFTKGIFSVSTNDDYYDLRVDRTRNISYLKGINKRSFRTTSESYQLDASLKENSIHRWTPELLSNIGESTYDNIGVFSFQSLIDQNLINYLPVDANGKNLKLLIRSKLTLKDLNYIVGSYEKGICNWKEANRVNKPSSKLMKKNGYNLASIFRPGQPIEIPIKSDDCQCVKFKYEKIDGTIEETSHFIVNPVPE